MSSVLIVFVVDFFIVMILTRKIESKQGYNVQIQSLVMILSTFSTISWIFLIFIHILNFFSAQWLWVSVMKWQPFQMVKLMSPFEKKRNIVYSFLIQSFNGGTAVFTLQSLWYWWLWGNCIQISFSISCISWSLYYSKEFFQKASFAY